MKKILTFAYELSKKIKVMSTELNNSTISKQENKKVLAGVLALVLGSIGVHKFFLGYTKEGIIQIVLTVVTCGIASLVPLIEGIIYLTKSDEEFYKIYQQGRKPWF